jgi:nucleoid-associated protein YgaU
MIRRPGVVVITALLTMALAASAAADLELYQVRRGDTLWSIAEVVLGDASLWPALYRANRDRIKDPRHVYPGQRLSVPGVEPGEVREIRREAETLLGRS